MRFMMKVTKKFFPSRHFRFLNNFLPGFVPRFIVIFLVHDANFEEKQRVDDRKYKQVQFSTGLSTHAWHINI